MNAHAAEFRRCLVDGDVAALRALWAHAFPHLEQPGDDEQAWTMLHRARTESQAVPFKLRAYSHRWLTDNGYDSGMPDELKPKAEHIYPRIVSAVGIACMVTSPHRYEQAKVVERAMSDAVAEAYADGRTEPEFVSKRMSEARERVLRS